MALTIEQITELYQTKGTAQYGSEAIDQQQHALQCAHLAEQAGASPELMVAALLHDLGHLLASSAPGAHAGVDDTHQYLAAPFLRGLYPDAVIEPIRMHVDAKRYLCSVDPGYWQILSPESQRSLALQGGIYTASQARQFIEQPFAMDAVALRRWDDTAKDPAAKPPGWSHYTPLLEEARQTSR